MDKRKLILGLAVLMIVAGALLACFSPGGIFNSGGTATIVTPIGAVILPAEKKSSAGPVIGYVLLAVGGVGFVVGLAVKSP